MYMILYLHCIIIYTHDLYLDKNDPLSDAGLLNTVWSMLEDGRAKFSTRDSDNHRGYILVHMYIPSICIYMYV